MISRKSVLAVAVCGLATVGVAACGGGSDTTTGGGGSSSNLSGEIAGAGSSAQEAAQQAWRVNFIKQNPNVTISYDPIGSGGGTEQFIAGGADYAGSDAPLQSDEIPKAQKTCGGPDNLVEVPNYVSPIAIAYNLSDVTDLQLSPETIAGIFNGDITSWDDPAIAKDNPDANLPSTDIVPVHRSDDSGTTFNFTDYLEQAAGSTWGHPASETFPVKTGESAEGTSGVVQAITAGEGTIGYADFSQVGDLGVAKVKVGNEYIAPTAEGAAKDLEISQLDKKLSPTSNMFAYSVERTSTDTSAYPVLLPSYTFACTQSSKADIVGAYLNYVISPEGQDAAAKAAGSAPITDALRSKIQPAVDAIGG